MDGLFYNDGLRFACLSCGKCCRISDGVVHLTEDDVLRMAGFFDVSREEFLRKYSRKEYKSRVLKDFPNGDCIFYREAQGCAVYEARPTQCRTFPFWKINLRSQETWESAAVDCHGMNTGRLYSTNEISMIADGLIETAK